MARLSQISNPIYGVSRFIVTQKPVSVCVGRRFVGSLARKVSFPDHSGCVVFFLEGKKIYKK